MIGDFSEEKKSLDMFITFTCNPKWQEIVDVLTYVPGQRPDARPDIVSQVFKLKVEEVVTQLKKGTYFWEGPRRYGQQIFTLCLCCLFGNRHHEKCSWWSL